ncbi:unnamed protein product [Ceratitis capitata]|uniref:(Mediterranean fruit fly) hypothetical protein n=1 Tax=Ceratitis capitata TaxID=7213 RepID=A0A811V238_CERCA|nr:unnamed protein product [Ceratitis capitata]
MQDKFATRVNEFCSIVDELKEVGVIVPDDFASILLLCSLPDEMESFVVAIESRDNLPKIDVLVSKILETEIRQNDKSAVNDEKVFLTKSRKFGGKRFEHTRSNIICFKCGKAGHIRSQCRGFVAKENSSDKACCLFETKSQNRDMWLLDSGASSHMCMDKKFFNELEPKRQEIVLASGKTIYAQGIGSVSLKTEFTNIKLHNVWYVPELTSNFFSIGKALKYGHTVKFSKNNAIMKTGKGENMLSAKFVGGVFVVKMALKKTAQKVNAIVETKQSVKWHERFGHVNMNDIRTLYNKKLVRGLNVTDIPNFQCMTCAMCKIHSLPFSGYGKVFSKNVLDLIHTDLCGPMRVKSLGGAFYFITFVDDFSRYVTVYFLKNKSDAFNAFKHFAVTAETQIGRKIKTVRSDNGREFTNMAFKNFCNEKGIVHQTSVGYTPQQNGVAERVNRTLTEMARCLLNGSGLNQYMWGEAINTAVYLRNRTVTKVLKDMTPYQVWYGKIPSVSHLKVFGCDVVSLKKGPHRGGKFDEKGIKLKFVGYAENWKGYRLYDPNKRNIVIARDCIFFENSFENFKEENLQEEEPFYYERNVLSSSIDEVNVGNGDAGVVEEELENGDDDEDVYSLDEDSDPVVARKRGRGRPKLIRDGGIGRPKKQYKEAEVLNFVGENPQTVNDALSSKEREHWKASMKSEFDSLTKNGTWVLVDRPKHKNVIGWRWVFTVKRKPSGEIEKFKARLVA